MLDAELFMLKSGRCVQDAAQSAKLFYIESVHPEQLYTENATGYTWDEAGMGDLFSECYLNDTRYCPEVKSWFTYDTGAWREDIDSLLVSEKIKEFSRLMALYATTLDDEETRARYLKFIATMGDRRFRDRLRKDAASKMQIRAAQFDNNPYLINCLNGTFDLTNMEFREHDYRDFLTMQTRFNFTVQDVHCARWEQFIREITQNDKEKALYLQKALGYSLLGTNPEECMFILHGKTTRNGKSTMLATIEHMMGDYSTVAPVELICQNDKDTKAENASPVLASLKGTRIVTMAESSQGGKVNESVLKQYTGGEPIKARALYQKPITFTPQFTLWLSCNDLPAVRDESLFASNRIRVVEFNRHFSENEQDVGLKDYFKTPEAMTGIFTWLLAGYVKYKVKGLVMCESMKDSIRQYRRENDLVMQFLEEKCQRVEDKGYVVNKTLYDTYKIWAKSNGYFVCSAKKFNAGVRVHPEWYADEGKVNGYTVYHGLQLKGV